MLHYIVKYTAIPQFNGRLATLELDTGSLGSSQSSYSRSQEDDIKMSTAIFF